MPTKTANLPASISTFTGPLFDYMDPEIHVEDVAHGLSNACRFAGQTVQYYSVAEHSCLVAAIVALETPELAFAALWHDAHEAYVGDIPTPLKQLLGEPYRAVTRVIDDAVADYLGLERNAFHAPEIVEADHQAMLYEASVLQPFSHAWDYTRELPHYEAIKAFGPLQCLLPEHAEQAFHRYHGALQHAS